MTSGVRKMFRTAAASHRIFPVRLIWISLVLIIGWAYIEVFSKYVFLGYFNDDADYVLAALSLGQGRFDTLWHPDQIPMSHFWPGYPLFLLPFVHSISPHWNWLPYTSCLLLLVTALLWHGLL